MTISMYLSGVSTIHTYDIIPFLNKETLASTPQHFRVYIDSGKIKDFLLGSHTERLQQFRRLPEGDFNNPNEFLAKLNIEALIADASSTALEGHSIDLIFSTVVLEHIQRQKVTSLFTDFHRISKPTAVMSHLISLKINIPTSTYQ